MSSTDNAMQPVTLHPIGVIHSPHRRPQATPIQPVYATGAQGQAEILPEYADGLQDLEGFSHVFLIYLFHKAAAPQLAVKPFLEDVSHGVFATRAPNRPNPIGVSLVRLLRREANVLHLNDVDILDGTPPAGHQALRNALRLPRERPLRLAGPHRRSHRPHPRPPRVERRAHERHSIPKNCALTPHRGSARADNPDRHTRDHASCR